jgi:hypothetical protein
MRKFLGDGEEGEEGGRSGEALQALVSRTARITYALRSALLTAAARVK